MLDEENKVKSLDNVLSFVKLQNGGVINGFHDTFDVLVVSNSKRYLYKNIEIYTSYIYAYMAWEVKIIWEDDENQTPYKDLGLHGSYSTNYQFFFLKGNTLIFYDGEKEITIFSQ